MRISKRAVLAQSAAVAAIAISTPALAQEADQVIEDAIDYAKNSPDPKIEEATRDVYSPLSA